MTCRTIAITNQKGGVGKTTTAVSLAAGLQKLGMKVLLIDTDSQCNSTDTYRAETDNVATLYDLLFEGEDPRNCVQTTELGDIIASDPLLREAEQKFPNDASRTYILKEKCESLKDQYDFIIVDTPPVIGIVLLNVLTFVDELIVPATADRYGLKGIDLLSQTIVNTRKYTNPNLRVSGILVIKYSGRLNICREFDEGLPHVAEFLDTKVFDAKIRESVSMRESQGQRTSIFEYDVESTTAADYMKLCDEILKER